MPAGMPHPAVRKKQQWLHRQNILPNPAPLPTPDMPVAAMANARIPAAIVLPPATLR